MVKHLTCWLCTVFKCVFVKEEYQIHNFRFFIFRVGCITDCILRILEVIDVITYNIYSYSL